MHRDVDERMCFEQGINRFPRYGHVLYLSTDENVTGGQTVVLSEGDELPAEVGVVLDGFKRRCEFLPLRSTLHLTNTSYYYRCLLGLCLLFHHILDVFYDFKAAYSTQCQGLRWNIFSAI